MLETLVYAKAAWEILMLAVGALDFGQLDSADRNKVLYACHGVEEVLEDAGVELSE